MFGRIVTRNIEVVLGEHPIGDRYIAEVRTFSGDGLVGIILSAWSHLPSRVELGVNLGPCEQLIFKRVDVTDPVRRVDLGVLDLPRTESND